jgi:hypothetical protein
MFEDAQVGEIQERALAFRAAIGAGLHVPNLTAQILPFPQRQRSGETQAATSAVAAATLQTVPMQPYAPPLQAWLTTQLAFEAQIHLTDYVQSWLFDSLAEIDQLPGVASDNNFPIPAERSLASTRVIARACSYLGLSQPTFDMRERGEIEIFCREGSRGLLILIHPNDIFQIFGDYHQDRWRARYDLTGPTWKAHLNKYLQELTLR